ncbi:MAG: hypothetical protein K2Z81_14345, partial [Cyanobacteria bacterium]|nr:hypothetical protein [Cyanobacteriota bacterium]
SRLLLHDVDLAEVNTLAYFGDRFQSMKELLDELETISVTTDGDERSEVVRKPKTGSNALSITLVAGFIIALSVFASSKTGNEQIETKHKPRVEPAVKPDYCNMRSKKERRASLKALKAGQQDPSRTQLDLQGTSTSIFH